MAADIQITRAKDEPGATTLLVEAPLEIVQRVERKATTYYAKRIRMPGFRKGKVPPDIVKKRFGDAIKEQVIRDIITDSWKIAIDQEKLEPLGEPQVRELKFEEGQPVSFEFLVEVKPAIELARLSGFTVARTIDPVSEAMAEERLEDIRRQKAPWAPVDGGKPNPGDMVRVTMAAVKEGKPEEANPYEIVIGAGQAIPEVEERILELTAGETKDRVITFPADFADESKRGQTITVRLELQEVKRQQLPEVTDDFARELGDFETAEDLRKAIREDLQTSANRDADANVRRQLMEQITTANNVPAPQPMIERLLRAYAEGYRIPEDRLEQFAGEFGPIVESQIKRDLVIDYVIREQNLQATEDEIDGRVEQIAKNQNTEPGKVYASLQKDGRLKDLERSVTEEKVFEWLLSQSTITES